MKTITVKKSDPPESKEILAEAIVRISDGFMSLQKSGLNREAIEVLIQAQTKLPRRDIVAVLNALARLKGWYCRRATSTTTSASTAGFPSA